MEVKAMLEFEGGPNPVQFFAKGHHDKRFFHDTVIQDHFPELDVSEEDLDHYVRHEYWRYVPTPSPCEDNEYVPLVIPSKKGPGAFPVTVIDV